MKIIEAMKLVKELNIKAEDLKKKVSLNCANLDFETPLYKDPAAEISGWIQAHHDVVKEIARLKLAIQKTNLATAVDILLDGKTVTHTIAEWITRRQSLAKMEEALWASLGDRGLKEQKVQPTAGGPITEIKIKRYFDPKVRDHMVELYRSEPGVIDRTLEVVNATTDLVD